MKRSTIERLLPGVFQRTASAGSPLGAIFEVMEALHEPAEKTIDTIGCYFSPYQAPDQFVPFLASWLDLDRFFQTGTGVPESSELSFPTGIGRLRELIAIAVHLSQWRGTVNSLQLFLQTATGIEGFEIDECVLDEEGRQRPFHVVFRVPREAASYRFLIERIIEQEKPAYVTYEIKIAELV